MLNRITVVALAALSLTACTKDEGEETAAPCGVEISNTCLLYTSPSPRDRG